MTVSVDAADRERRVDARRVVDVQDDAAAARGLESGERDLDDVGADGQEVEPVGAGFVGRHGAHEAGLDVASGDGRAGQRGAAGVGDGADDGGAGDLGIGAGASSRPARPSAATNDVLLTRPPSLVLMRDNIQENDRLSMAHLRPHTGIRP